MTVLQKKVNKKARYEIKKSSNKLLDEDPIIPPITTWAEEKRYLPTGSTVRPGMWKASFVPYAQEIQEMLHPYNPARIVSIIKSTQSLLTTTIENTIGHSIRYGLHNILYTISDIEVAKMRSSGAIDLLIDYCGLQEYIRPMTKRDNQRKSGDTILYKELGGGRRFLMTSYKSLAKLKSFSYDLIIMDELAEAPHQLKGQGDPESIIEKRGQTIKNLKVAKLSTPGKNENCKIYKAFKSGDQREYMIPCPRCGGFQHLVLMKNNMEHGLYGEYEIDKRKKASLVSGTVRYKCVHCKKDFFEYEKPDFMLNKENGGLAYWEPQAKAQDPRDHSYHISAIMSPLTEWSNIITDWLKTDFGQKMQEYKNFVITNEGFPPLSTRNIKPWKDLQARAEDYPLGVAPKGVMLLLAGVDVQKKRLELHVIGVGYGLETWSFDYQIFYGETANLNDKCWQDLLNYANKKYQILDKEVYISKIAVDIGYNPNKDKTISNESLKNETNAVLSFCKKYNDVFLPVRGVDDEKMMSITRQMRHKEYDIYYYQIDSAAIKDELLDKIDIAEGPKAIHFSKNYDEEFFRQFLSEIFTELDDGKMGYKKINERNETLDTFIYAKSLIYILNIDRWDDTEWDNYKISLIS